MIRLLNPEKESLAVLFKGFEDDSKFVRIDVDYADQTYRDLISTGAGQIFLMFDVEMDSFIGGLGCLKAPDLHNGEMIAVETFWYVVPEYRDSAHGIELLFAFEKWAKDNNCTKMAMIHLADSSPERLKKLYERLGYKLLESHYIKEV